MRFFLFLWLLCGVIEVNATTYYVAKTGNDSNPGTVGSPKLTIQAGVNLCVAGDTVKVATGTYAENVWPDTASGSAGSPITIDGQNVATMKSIIFSRPYFNFINFTMAPASGGTVFGGAIYVAQAGSHLIISNNIIDPNFDATITPVIKWDGPASSPFGTAGSDNLVISNIVRNVRGEMTFRVHGYRNVISGNQLLNLDAADCFQVFGGTNYIVGNLCSNMFTSGLYNNHQDFFQTFPIPSTGIGSRGHLIESNTVIHMETLAQLGNLEDNNFDANVQELMFRNNLFIGIAAKMSIAMPGVKFYNNIFYNCATNLENGGPLLIWTDAGSIGQGHNGQCFNNIFLNCGIAGDSRDNGSGWYIFDTTLTNVAADYNYVGKDGYQPVVVDGLHRMIGAGGGWSKWEWWEDHGINGGNPRFINESALDFRLLSTSPLIGAGLAQAAFTNDFRGLTRSEAWEIGPYEFQLSDSDSGLPCPVGPRTIRAYSLATSNSTTLVWPGNTLRLEMHVARRAFTNKPSAWPSWVEIYANTNLATVTNGFSFADTNTAGTHYEYELQQVITNYVCSDLPTNGYRDFQYISSGYRVPLKDTRGKLVLMVESGLAASLPTEMTRLVDDLVGEGYTVFRHDVAAVDVTSGGWTAAVAATKALVVADYNGDTSADWTLFIVGHVPIPYSGDNSPGSHSENLGAHPADWFYADMTGTWADTTVNDSTATDSPVQHNTPGDGKFDPSLIPASPTMRLGRVDLRDMRAFGLTEAQLMSRYLTRNHQWRHKQFSVRNQALVFSTTNISAGNSPAKPIESHNQAASLFGNTSSVTLTNWLLVATNAANSFLFAADEGSGGFDHDNNLGTTVDFAASPGLYVAFPHSYGSYYGDWDSTVHSNIFTWAALASDGYAVASYYRENFVDVDSSAMGEPVGHELFAMGANYFAGSGKWYSPYARIVPGSGEFLIIERLSQYNSLLGDPTLRMRPVGPATNALVSVSGADNSISWTASTDSGIQGYHVYRASAVSNTNSFTRLTSNPTTSPYTDTGGSSGSWRYMVRTVKLEDSVNRSFYSSSQGVFATSSGGGASLPNISTSGRVGTSGRVVFQ